MNTTKSILSIICAMMLTDCGQESNPPSPPKKVSEEEVPAPIPVPVNTVGTVTSTKVSPEPEPLVPNSAPQSPATRDAARLQAMKRFEESRRTTQISK